LYLLMSSSLSLPPLFFFLPIRPPPISTLFPYTTLFRSSQTATTHHFILTRDGGLIQVEVNDAADAENRDAVRQHLAHIARLFAEGDFNTPMLVHDRVPPGVARMQRLRTEITYEYEETDSGARVRIKTKSAEALTAVHDFLRFQI